MRLGDLLQSHPSDTAEQGGFEHWINDLPINTALGELFRFGAALHIDRPKRGTVITSTSLLFALLESQSDFAPSLLVSDPFCLAFSQAAHHLSRETYQDIWSDYLKDAASFGRRLPKKLPHPSYNVRKMVTTSGLAAESRGARNVSVEHIIDAILKLKTGRLVARLKRSHIKIADLKKEYLERLGSMVPGQPTQIIDTGRHPIADGMPPEWASGWGQDQYGVFTEITVENVTQRLRWIPPGRFLMGSPEDEPGRWNDEGPQTEITLANGYWLFDTPVTQALWQAVMGQNPSRFMSEERPVEQVSWHESQRFLAAMNERFAGLGLYLPSEAQWEYACRGGTGAATYAGPIEIIGVNNAPILDAIAWYGGNSGVGFDLDSGFDSSGWSEKQYAHERAGTRMVRTKRPNAYGLYDMLGNVWEWCADVWSDGHQGADPDGAPRQSDSQPGLQDRVVRGGSWFRDARRARAAYRYRLGPGTAGNGLGFRCAAGQSGPEAQTIAFGPDVREAEPRLAYPKAGARQRASRDLP